ncbi:hypothetical protein ALO57_101273 [Pseudomonas coronafaciens pv. oryzae]|nr:hypothetical protein ALO57_101273 [Pseudomonas coronafaciens pv. oryzae]
MEHHLTVASYGHLLDALTGPFQDLGNRVIVFHRLFSALSGAIDSRIVESAIYKLGEPSLFGITDPSCPASCHGQESNRQPPQMRREPKSYYHASALHAERAMHQHHQQRLVPLRPQLELRMSHQSSVH